MQKKKYISYSFVYTSLVTFAKVASGYSKFFSGVFERKMKFFFTKLLVLVSRTINNCMLIKETKNPTLKVKSS